MNKQLQTIISHPLSMNQQLPTIINLTHPLFRGFLMPYLLQFQAICEIIARDVDDNLQAFQRDAGLRGLQLMTHHTVSMGPTQCGKPQELQTAVVERRNHTHTHTQERMVQG
jgi:hypothetical protein